MPRSASSSSKNKPLGGLKGFFMRAYGSVSKLSTAGGSMAYNGSFWVAQKVGRIGIIVATTSMVAFMPLFFEIAREQQMLDTEKALVKDMKSKGYSDMQLMQMGFSETAIHTPSVANVVKKQ